MKHYTWKSKVKMLLMGIGVFSLLIYNMAIKKTLNERRLSIELEKNQADNASLQHEINNMQKLHSKEPMPKENTYNSFKEAELMVSMASNSEVIARKLPDQTIIEFQDRELFFQTYYFSGSFFDLLRLLDSTEQHRGLNLLNAEFYKDLNPLSRELELILKIETARIGNKKNESTDIN